METKSLEDLLKDTIESLKQNKVDDRIISFNDYKNEFTVLKPTVIVELALKKGIVAKVDVTDYFTGVLK